MVYYHYNKYPYILNLEINLYKKKKNKIFLIHLILYRLSAWIQTQYLSNRFFKLKLKVYYTILTVTDILKVTYINS